MTKAFTLTELLVVLAILGVALVTVFGVVGSCDFSGDTERMLTIKIKSMRESPVPNTPRLVFTDEHGVLQVSDNLLYGVHNSSDLWSKLLDYSRAELGARYRGAAVDVLVRGKRNPRFSRYPFILEVRPHENPLGEALPDMPVPVR